MMAYSYDAEPLRDFDILGDGERYVAGKSAYVKKKVKEYLWREEKHACYDRDENNEFLDILVHNNIRCMYHGLFDDDMAYRFLKYHLFNPEEFWTPMPLPSIAVNDKEFRNIPENNWSGQPEGLTFQRTIRALENYGHYAELVPVARLCLRLSVMTASSQQFDPFTKSPLYITIRGLRHNAILSGIYVPALRYKPFKKHSFLGRICQARYVL